MSESKIWNSEAALFSVSDGSTKAQKVSSIVQSESIAKVPLHHTDSKNIYCVDEVGQTFRPYIYTWKTLYY